MEAQSMATQFDQAQSVSVSLDALLAVCHAALPTEAAGSTKVKRKRYLD